MNSGKNKENSYFELIYLFNPISILNCGKLRLDIFYFFIQILFFRYQDKFLGILALTFSLLISPNYLFLSVFFMFYLINNETQSKATYIKNLFISLIIIFFSVHSDFSRIDWDRICLFIQETKYLYFNYFTMKDSLPNLGFFWYLLPEVNDD
jgi:hypothetical protein